METLGITKATRDERLKQHLCRRAREEVAKILDEVPEDVELILLAWQAGAPTEDVLGALAFIVGGARHLIDEAAAAKN